MTEIIESLANSILGVHDYVKTPMLTNSVLLPYSVTVVEDGERRRALFLSKGMLIAVAVHHKFTSITPSGERHYIVGRIRELLGPEEPNYRILCCFSAGPYNPMIKIEDLATYNHFYMNL